MPIIVAIVAMLVGGVLYVVQTNFVACTTALCKQAARQELHLAKAEREKKLAREELEAPRRLELSQELARAAERRRERELELKAEEVAAAREREHNLQMAKIRAEAEAKARVDAIQVAKAAAEIERARAASQPRERFTILGHMTDRGMGQSRRHMIRRAPPPRRMHRRQPRYELGLKCGYPGRWHPCR